MSRGKRECGDLLTVSQKEKTPKVMRFPARIFLGAR